MLTISIGYLISLFLIWLFFYLRWRLYPPITKENEIFHQVSKYHQIIRIKNNLYYYKGIYITPDYMYYLDFKIQHFRSLFFIRQFLKSI